MVTTQIFEGEIHSLNLKDKITKVYHTSPYEFIISKSDFYLYNPEIKELTEIFPFKIIYFSKVKSQLKDGIGKFNEVNIDIDSFDEIFSEEFQVFPAITSLNHTKENEIWKITLRFDENFLKKFKNLNFFVENAKFDILNDVKTENLWILSVKTWEEIDYIEIIIKSERLILRKTIRDKINDQILKIPNLT